MNILEERLEVLKKKIGEKEQHLMLLEEKHALLDSAIEELEEVISSLDHIESIDEDLING